MDPVMSLFLIGGGLIAVVAAVAVWLAVKRPAQSLERRQRNDALAAAERYTPAPRQSVYGAPARPDPCAPGLSDHERVAAMRALLQRGDAQLAAGGVTGDGFAVTQPSLDDEVATTTPMAWKPTLPPDEADAVHSRQSRKRTASAGQGDTVSLS